MDLTSATITLGSIIAIVGCLIGVLNFISNKKHASKEDEARLIRMEKDLLYIREKIDDVKGKVEKHDVELQTHETRIVKLETKSKKRSY